MWGWRCISVADPRGGGGPDPLPLLKLVKKKDGRHAAPQVIGSPSDKFLDLLPYLHDRFPTGSIWVHHGFMVIPRIDMKYCYEATRDRFPAGELGSVSVNHSLATPRYKWGQPLWEVGIWNSN